MATYEYVLSTPPADERNRELWLQHAAGFILFENVRGYAVEKIDPGLSEDARAAAVRSIDDTLYGLMQVFDGVSGSLKSPAFQVDLQVLVRLVQDPDAEAPAVVSQVDLAQGDGMCMGIHDWREGNFGEDPVAERRTKP